LLDEGRIIQSGTTQEVFDAPTTPAPPGLSGWTQSSLGRLRPSNMASRASRSEDGEVAPVPADAGHEAALCIRAEDVTIALHDAVDLARSTTGARRPIRKLRGAVRRVSRFGFRLSARHARRLAVAGVEGGEAWAIVKATTIRALPRLSDRMPVLP
jgi:ABC-type sulfate/molybdate transport systems ATPase subunit